MTSGLVAAAVTAFRPDGTVDLERRAEDPHTAGTGNFFGALKWPGQVKP